VGTSLDTREFILQIALAPGRIAIHSYDRGAGEQTFEHLLYPLCALAQP
jgi:hypothetical protein